MQSVRAVGLEDEHLFATRTNQTGILGANEVVGNKCHVVGGGGKGPRVSGGGIGIESHFKRSTLRDLHPSLLSFAKTKMQICGNVRKRQTDQARPEKKTKHNPHFCLLQNKTSRLPIQRESASGRIRLRLVMEANLTALSNDRGKAAASPAGYVDFGLGLRQHRDVPWPNCMNFLPACAARQKVNR